MGEALGAAVVWDGKTNMATVTK
ncbi:hypothetical protein ACIFQM_03895 [Paenibacillus sp. NRS-1782]